MRNIKQMCLQSRQGFSLIELLVVISIIGILSSFAVVSLNDARGKARDALRKGDMAQIRTALNLYYDDHQNYPSCGTWSDTAPYGAPQTQDAANCYNALAASLTAGTRPYLGSLPKDPRNLTNTTGAGGSAIYLYRYVSDGEKYALIFRTEDNQNIDQVSRGW